MAIRLRVIDNRTVALCAARSMPQTGDVYLDDAQHEALSYKFGIDFGVFEGDLRDEMIDGLVDEHERNNPNREWWDVTYGKSLTTP